MNQTIFYDQVYKAKAWIVLESNKYAANLVEAFVSMGAFDQKWPTDLVPDAVKDLEIHGWWSTVNPAAYPQWINEDFVEALFRNVMKRFAGENVYSAPQLTYSQGINRKIESNRDFTRVFNEALGLEDPLTLSRMFDLANPKSKLYITHGGDASVVRKICDSVITVGDKTSMVSVGKKRVEEVVEEIEAMLPKSLKG